jgi:hypothetical protein
MLEHLTPGDRNDGPYAFPMLGCNCMRTLGSHAERCEDRRNHWIALCRSDDARAPDVLSAFSVPLLPITLVPPSFRASIFPSTQLLILAQNNHGIGSHSAPRGNIACNKSYADQYHSHNDERQWIGHSHSVKQMREIPENSTQD